MKHLTSQELLARTKNLVAEERRITLLLIEYLEEVQRRRLYAELGYSSMWEFATRELGLSEGAAQRRIQAMRLVRDVPEAKEALAEGRLSLSNAAKVQSFRQAEKKQGRKPDASALVQQVERLSQRECEQKLFEISPEALPRERERVVSAQAERELKLVVSAELYEKLQRLRGLLAHAMPEASYAELLEYMTDEVLSRVEKKKGLTASHDADPAPTAAAIVDLGSTAAAIVTEPEANLPPGKRVYLPQALQRAVFSRSGGRCEFTTAGERRCSSRYRLQIDHRTPLAMGGGHELSNLRILCFHHNQAQARERLRGRP